MLKRLSIFAIIFATLIGFSSCGDDDDDDMPEVNSSSTFTINGKKAGNILYTLCELTTYPSWLGGDTEITLEVHFYHEDELMSFDATLPYSSISALKNGKDISTDIDVTKYYMMNSAFTGHKSYEYISGKAVVQSVSSTAVVVKYSNYKFLRELGNNEDTFTINGTISYTIND